MPTICFIIHGIGPQDQQFADELQGAVHRAIPQLAAAKAKAQGKAIDAAKVSGDLSFRPLYWADIGSAEQNDLYRKIYPELFGVRSGPRFVWQTLRQLGPVRDLSITLIGDILSYLGRFGEAIRRQVYAQITAALQPHLDAKRPLSLVIVGHSLGSVIVHDLLVNLVKYGGPGYQALLQRTAFVTIGSPIALFSLVAKRDALTGFRSWTNLRHRWDPVAFPLAPLDAAVEDVTVSCWRFWRQPSNWFKVLKPHTLYWSHPDVHRAITEEIIEHFAAEVPKVCNPLPSLTPPLEVFSPGNQATTDSGLAEYCDNFGNFQFGPLLCTAQVIDICVVYGHTWIGQNHAAITMALQNPNCVIRVGIVSPTSPALPGLCHLFGDIPPEKLIGKLNDVRQLYIDATKEARRRAGKIGRLRFYHLSNPPNHGFYRIDDRVLVTPRPTTGTKAAASPLPMMIYRPTDGKHGVFEWIMRDFELLLENDREAQLVFDSEKQTGDTQPPQA